jgi:N-acetylmuramic acid 6-phosphate etherase
MTDYRDLIQHLDSLATEQSNPATRKIDRLSASEIVSLINQEDQTVALVVERSLPQIAKAAELFASTIRNGGRVFYLGAGTSGRLGVLDAAECPPTFGTDPALIIGVICGGYETLVMSREGAEDRTDDAVADLRRHDLSSADLVIGLAASIRTPYTLAGLDYARRRGAGTVHIVCNEVDKAPVPVDILITLPVGPEVITGSTRMKSGTAQKMTLNMISSTAMVLLGKTYGNLMVDLQVRSEKLAARSRKIMIDLFDLEPRAAEALLAAAEGSVKIAIIMHRLECDRSQAKQRLAAVDGFVWRCLQEADPDCPQ